jgi:arylsulfatase A-like enzyme
LHYQFDFAATVLEMTGRAVPESWDARSFYNDFKEEKESGRDYLILSNCAWSCQRAVRWEDYIMIRTYHSGFKNYPEIMLFNLKEDPHELKNLAEERPDLVGRAMAMLDEWHTEEMRRSPREVDPMWTVMREGGPYHASFNRPSFDQYVNILNESGREDFAKELHDRKRKLTSC